jgi:hypothetical protein
MIKLFRHIRQNLIMENKTSKYFKYAIGEIVLVVIGILIALQLNTWKEENTEKKLVKQYVSSLIEDLKSDTTRIAMVLDYREEKFLKMDSLMLMLKNQDIEGNENDLYFFSRILVRTWTFKGNDRTIAQLKNSSSLRLIKNKRVTDSIMAYQNLIDGIYGNQDDESDERYKAMIYINQIFNPFVFEEMVTENVFKRPINNPPLRTYDPTLQQDFAHWIHQIKGSNFIISGKLERLKEQSVNLINLLIQEYEDH